MGTVREERDEAIVTDLAGIFPAPFAQSLVGGFSSSERWDKTAVDKLRHGLSPLAYAALEEGIRYQILRF